MGEPDRDAFERALREGEDPFGAAVEHGLLANAPFQPRWPYSDWRHDGAGRQAPECPDCGQPVRSAEARRDRPMPGCANPPWNAGWDGTCEACGKRFELVVHTPLHFRAERTATFRPAAKPYRTFVDEGFVLSGVEVTVADREWPGEGAPRTETYFLSMAEVLSLAQALDGRLHTYLEQLDWSHDWT